MRAVANPRELIGENRTQQLAVAAHLVITEAIAQLDLLADIEILVPPRARRSDPP
jgi:hypothetical protein